ncbi:uncharacterized protein LOC128132401 [Lactuca sativa]|uniref:uncharacterized protein LOC128132401 n=1 Tax=Lactuca sativa TaxID=4236 RepID=UPI0022AEE7AC|nr:uncharacterized protein LOC128132401 [Lactuca sativa]
MRITQYIEKTSVLKLQVGLLGTGKSLQKDLNQIAETADTSKPEGLRYVLQETTLALLRHPDYCIYGYSFVDVKRSIDEGEKRFNQLSIEERGKFDEETLVNVNNIRKQSATTQRSNDFRNEYIVVSTVHIYPSFCPLYTIYFQGERFFPTFCIFMIFPVCLIPPIEFVYFHVISHSICVKYKKALIYSLPN